jgi:hypothetical protein
MVLDIALVNEVRLQCSQPISNFEHGLNKKETCFGGMAICPYT